MLYNLAMPRLAWFSPLPPDRSGIAAYSSELVPLLAHAHSIDIYIDRAAPTPTVDLGVPVWPSTDFIRRHQAQPYDLVVYQIGNARCHDYMWAYLGRFPGLVVLHDAQLHHARAMNLLTSGRAADYRAEFAFCHPDANPGLAELVIAALGGSLYFLWPLNRVPIDCARLVAVHSPGLAAQLRESYPAQEFHVVEMGVADPTVGPSDLRPASPNPRGGEGGTFRPSEVRSRHAIPAERVLFAAYGMLTPEKRLTEIFKAMRSLLTAIPDMHLLLVGQPADYYDVEADARGHGVAEHVSVTGYVTDGELPSYLAAADVCLCLRWPTSRETSASWLRCLAAGKPTVVNDLVHTADVPALDPRSWTPTMPITKSGDGRSGAAVGPICVAVDIVDEQHSLGLAMRRLARDGQLREELGRRAREYWAAGHTLGRMAADYHEAIEAALRRPAPDRSHLPAHLLQDGTALTRRILGEFGLSMGALD